MPDDAVINTTTETTPDPTPPADPPQTEPAEPPAEPNADVAKLEAELAAARASLAKAESAAKAANMEKTKLQRAQMSEAQLLEEQKKEVEENAKKYKVMIATAKAKTVLSGKLPENEYSQILELITSDDNDDKPEAIATEIVNIIINDRKAQEKELREKILKETPRPPVGDPPGGAALSMEDEIRRKLYGT